MSSVSKWLDIFPNMVYHLTLLGATSKEIASALNVSESTVKIWSTNNVEFMEAMRKGKLEADTKVASAFFLNTQDRFVEVEDVHVSKGVVIRVKRQQFIQGDKWCQAQWLAKRRRGDWTDSQTVNINRTNTNINLDFTGMSFEELKMMERIGYTQLKALPQEGEEENGGE